jgi:hypothetical protein
MVLTAYFGLSSVTGLSCHRRLQDHHLDRLDISVGISGPHDLAVRAGAARQHAATRPPHPAPNVRDDRDTPLLSRRDGLGLLLFLPNEKAKNFLRQGWTRIY